jgi:hypothetical protein
MKTDVPTVSRAVSRGALMLISYLLLAACMQHEESLSPRADLSVNADELNARSGEPGAMVKTTFTAHLKSSNEPPTNGVPVMSDGQGQAIFTLSDDGLTLYYKLIVANIDEVTQAHIHCGMAGVNGPVVAFLYGFNAAGADVNGILAEGSITAANVIARPASASCSGGLQTFEDLIMRIRNGTAYVNVHTFDYPGGEIRGQIN